MTKKNLGLVTIMASLCSLSSVVVLLFAAMMPCADASMNSCAVMAYVTKKRCNRNVEDNNLILAQCIAQNCTSMVRQRERSLLRAPPSALETAVTTTKTTNKQRNLDGPAPPTCEECIHHDCPSLGTIPAEWCELFCPFYNQGDCRRETKEMQEAAEMEEAAAMEEAEWEQEELEDEYLFFDEDNQEAAMAFFREDGNDVPTSRKLTDWVELDIDEDHECIEEWYENVHHSCFNNPGLTVMVRNCVCDEDWV